MNQQPRTIDTELAVVGTGLAGIAATVFALNRGIDCSLAGNTGALAYTTGYLDLLGYDGERFLHSPWESIGTAGAAGTIGANHPLAKIEPAAMREAFTEFTDSIDNLGLGYTAPGDTNLLAFTPAGTIKPTLCVPKTMEKGVQALAATPPCLIVGFRGLKGFSAHQIVANLRHRWPALRATTLDFPDHPGGELYAEVAARSLEVAANRERLARVLRDIAGEATHIGLPALLGMHNPDVVLSALEQLTGLSLFEIPTMPPSVPGIRLREAVEQKLPARGATLIPQQKVKQINFGEKTVQLRLADSYGPIAISARTVLLATGRFLSGGLTAHFDHISEPLVGLPVAQPDSRSEWYQEEYLDSRGHAIHLAGVETDADLRPLADGKLFDPRLYAAGIVLAHQDWIRQRCGAGVAIATAWRAVQAITRQLGK